MPRFKNDPEEEPKTQTVSRSDGVDAAGAYYQDYRPKRHTGRIVAIVILSIVVVLGVAGGIVGMRLMNSAQEVKAEAREVMDELNGLKDAVKSTDAARLQQISSNVSVKAHNIQDEVNTSLWNFATVIPVYGQDVKSAQALADVLVDLSDNALAPLASNSDIMNLNNLFVDGAVNVEALTSLSNMIYDAGPVLDRCAKTIEALPPAHLNQVSEMLDKAKDKIVTANELVENAQTILPYLPAMFGANGETRRYLIVAQNNAELRSTGGLPGSWGVMSVTDGKMELGDFSSYLHLPDLQVGGWEEEHAFFGTDFDQDPAQVNCIADFSRVGTMCREYWQQIAGEDVDGVVAIDPVFLQHMLALTGGFETYDGTYIDGSNAASELLNGAYWRYGDDTEAEDYFFAEVASIAASSFLDHISDASFTDLFKALKKDMKEHRFLAWMFREEEQNLVRIFGADGEISSDTTQPELGIYLNDDTFSKISWYAGLNVNVGAPVKNSDGTTSYDVSFTLSNVMTDEEAAYAPKYITGLRDLKRSDGDMLDFLYVIAPAGGSLSDVECEGAEYISMGSVYGHQGFSSHIYTMNGEDHTYTMRVTVPAEAQNTLSVRTTPLGQEGLWSINYAQAPTEVEGDIL